MYKRFDEVNDNKEGVKAPICMICRDTQNSDERAIKRELCLDTLKYTNLKKLNQVNQIHVMTIMTAFSQYIAMVIRFYNILIKNRIVLILV